jgi:hypothetical protein
MCGVIGAKVLKAGAEEDRGLNLTINHISKTI